MENINTCPICFETPLVPPVYQCYEGHVVCRECEGKLQHCPTCREPLPKKKKIRNLVVEQAQPEPMLCRHRGCRGKFSREMDRTVHEATCDYRPIRLCQLTGIDKDCLAEFTCAEVDEAKKHLELVHQNNTTSIRQQHSVFIKDEVDVCHYFYLSALKKPSVLVILKVENRLRKRNITTLLMGGPEAASEVEAEYTIKHLIDKNVEFGKNIKKVRSITTKTVHTTPTMPLVDQCPELVSQDFPISGFTYLERVSVFKVSSNGTRIAQRDDAGGHGEDGFAVRFRARRGHINIGEIRVDDLDTSTSESSSSADEIMHLSPPLINRRFSIDRPPTPGLPGRYSD